MPAKSKMIVAKNGRVERSMAGTSAPGENGGRTMVCPDPNYRISGRRMRIAGMMLPRITPTFPNFVVASSPKYAMAVVPQNAIIITLNM